MPEKEGFSYESKEKQRKSAAKLLAIEIGALILAVIIIVGILTYMGVFSLKKVTTALKDWREVKIAFPSQKDQAKKDQQTKEDGKDVEIVVPAQRGYGPGDDSSDWKPPEWMK